MSGPRCPGLSRAGWWWQGDGALKGPRHAPHAVMAPGPTCVCRVPCDGRARAEPPGGAAAGGLGPMFPFCSAGCCGSPRKL